MVGNYDNLSGIRNNSEGDYDNRKSTFSDLSKWRRNLVIIEQTPDSSIYTTLLVNKHEIWF